MKHYSYFLFHPLLIVIGCILLGISIYQFLFEIDYAALGDASEGLVGAIGFAFFGLMLITFRTRFSMDAGSKLILKQYRVFGLLLSKEQIRVPGQAKRVLIKERTKTASSYVQAVVKFGYRIKSCDLYFEAEHGMVKIISTDDERAIKIARLIKDHLGVDYEWQTEKRP
jgi:hypothetical protein